ncbi:MAG: ATP-binding cassette domain-containing protein, partial [Pseudomonadota bacterium]
MAGAREASRKLRIGYFAQHQGDELVMEETPLDHFRRALPETLPTKLRARLAAAGIGADIVETPVSALSGGQKARLLLALAALDAPHLLILDEPTNHLDIESREALVEALNLYEGAVILITHDAHLIELVADRLWLVKDGAVTPFEEDMATYRQILLSPNQAIRGESKETRKKPKRPSAEAGREIARLRAEIKACEDRVAQLTALIAKIDARLAEPGFYNGPVERITQLNIKREEVVAAQEAAEAKWLAAEEALDATTAEA